MAKIKGTEMEAPNWRQKYRSYLNENLFFKCTLVLHITNQITTIWAFGALEGLGVAAFFSQLTILVSVDSIFNVNSS